MVIRMTGLLFALAYAGASTATAQGLAWSHTPAQDAGIDLSGHALETFDDGSGLAVYVGGQISMAGGNPARRIARWNGVSWSAVGLGFQFGNVHALQAFNDGSGPALYAGGTFSHAGTSAAPYLARWDGNDWSTVGDGMQQPVHCLLTWDDGTGPALYVGRDLDTAGSVVRRWDGVRWTSLPAPPVAFLRALCMTVHTDAQGTALWVGGTGGVSTRLARWDGTSWSEPTTFAVGVNVKALCSHDDGTGPKLYAGGNFILTTGPTVTGIARRDAAGVWSPLLNGLATPGLNGEVRALLSYDDGTGRALYAGGDFLSGTNGATLRRIARWFEGNWSMLDSGIDTGVVNALELADLGGGAGAELFVTGGISSAGGDPVNNFARWTNAGPSGGAYCLGDGSGRPCPCGNTSTSASRSGCLNSLGTGGKLVASGVASLANDTLVLHASQMPATTTAVICQGTVRESFGAGLPFGDGLRCVGGRLIRLSTSTASAGMVQIPADGQRPLSARGAVSRAGGTRLYQAVYRSAASYCTPATFNATNGWIVRWVP